MHEVSFQSAYNIYVGDRLAAITCTRAWSDPVDKRVMIVETKTESKDIPAIALLADRREVRFSRHSELGLQKLCILSERFGEKRFDISLEKNSPAQDSLGSDAPIDWVVENNAIGLYELIISSSLK